MDDEEYRETRDIMSDQLRKDVRYQEAYTHLAEAGEEAARVRADDQKDPDEQLDHNTENARVIATKAGERVNQDQADIETYDKAHGWGLMEPDWGAGGGSGAGGGGGPGGGGEDGNETP